MAIIKIIVRKMMNNRWLTSSLFLGLLITVALVASIPIFTSGVLQKLLISDLDNHYIENQEYPGEFSYSVNFSQDDDIDRINTLENVEIIKDRKSTRLNSSHVAISYAVFCLKKKKRKYNILHIQAYCCS